MATNDDITRSAFSYIWTIENYMDMDLRSPSFVVKSIGDTVWNLHILHRYAGFFYSIEAENFSKEKSNGIDFEFSFISADGTPIISEKSSKPRLFLRLIKKAAFMDRLAEFIPNNTLTIRCRMWKREVDIPSDVCYARTRLKTFMESFIWAIENFSSLPSSAVDDFRCLTPNERKVYPLKAIADNGPFLALILYLKRNSKSEDVSVSFLLEKGRDYAISCDLSILDANGKVIVSDKRRFHVEYGWAILRFSSLIKKDELIAKKNLFLPNDTFILRCSYEVCTGVISNEIEYFTPNVSTVVEEARSYNTAEAEADDSLEFEEYFVK